MNPKVLRWVSWVFCLLIACVFAIKNVTQLDFFWMLRTGDWIIQNKSVPQTDILSYTFNGIDWINVKWFYQVIIYFIADMGKPELIPLLQIFINGFVVLLIFKTSAVLKRLAGERSKIIPTAGIIIATYFYLFGSEYRMMGRPEIISHLMTLLFLYIYLSYKKTPSLFIYCLIPLQIVWANCHDAFVNGCVISVVFLLTAFREYRIQQKQSRLDYRFPKHLVIASVLSLLSIGINPRGAELYLYPFRLFSSLNNNTFSQEFLSVLNSQYWTGKESYLLLLAFSICVAGLFFYFKDGNRKQRLLKAVDVFGMEYLVILSLFFYLALSAERNVVFFMIISAPLIAVIIDRLISNFRCSVNQKRKGYIIICGCSLLFYISVCNNSYYKVLGIPYKYGLTIEQHDTPAATVQFMKDQRIAGVGFSDYLSSSVLLWYLKPEFKSYIDLRDLEVFTTAFFDEYQQMIVNPKLFDQKDDRYHFDYAALYPNEAPALHRHLFNNDNWVLVYLEPSCALYLKRNERNKSIIEQLAPAKNISVFHVPLAYKASSGARLISTFFWPFYKAESHKNENGQYASFASGFYQMLNVNNHKVNNAADYMALAQAEMNKKDWTNAIDCLEKILITKEETGTYLLLAECAGAIHAENDKDGIYLEKWFGYMQKANSLEPDNPRVRLMLGLAFCMDKRDKVSGKKYLKGLENFDGMTEQETALLQRCKEFCGIQ